MVKKELSAREAALAALARREHARAELAGKLVQKGFVGWEIAKALDELEAKGTLNDMRYAAARARYRAVFSKWGWSKIVQELRGAGVDDAAVAAAKTGLVEEGVVFADEAKKFGKRLANKEREKAIAALVRRGYSFGEAKAALEQEEEA